MGDEMISPMGSQVIRQVTEGSAELSVTDRLRLLQRFCSDFGGSLASVHDIWEYNFLQRMVRSAGYAFAWTGGYYFEVSSAARRFWMHTAAVEEQEPSHFLV